MSLEGRVAIITGASGGLGRVVARRFADDGARLALFERNAERLERLADELALPQDRYLYRAVDLAERAGAQAAADAAIERFGKADILVHLVGGFLGGKPVTEVESGEVSSMLTQHVWTTFNMAQAFVPHLVANGWGRIIAVSSPLALSPAGSSSPYAIGKAGQEVLLLSVAQELKGTGVTANVVLVRSIDVDHERDRNPTPANASATTPEEISAAIAYLASDEAGTVNGARIPMYGGP
jgi:NAD(P)-dependent dehydrogenase (short-subunit alcohol dehydrogenase family)